MFRRYATKRVVVQWETAKAFSEDEWGLIKEQQCGDFYFAMHHIRIESMKRFGQPNSFFKLLTRGSFE